MAAQSAMNYVLIGTLIMELFLNKNIEFEKSRIILKNQKSPNALHQFLLDKIGSSSRNQRVATWINKFNFSMKFIRKEVQQDLVQKRIIRMEQKRFLIFRWESPVIANFQTLYRLLSEIENMVTKGINDNENLILLSFLKPAGLISRIFPEREKRKFAQEKLKKIMAENQVSVAAANAIAAANAVAASVAVLAAVSSASHSS